MDKLARMPNRNKDSVERSRWLRWLHRIGYATTALVVAELLLISFFATRTWLQAREVRAAQIESTRSHEAALQAKGDDIVLGSAAYLLRQLPPANALHGDGIRFVAMPSFNRAHVAVAIFMPQPDAAEAQGILLRFDEQKNYAPLSTRQFQMPAAAYRSLVAKMDKLGDGWPGDSGFWMDGTPTAFERVRGRRITSGLGNSPHYEHVAILMWNYLHRFAPGDDLVTRSDWEPVENS
jgi:hypothetical protein